MRRVIGSVLAGIVALGVLPAASAETNAGVYRRVSGTLVSAEHTVLFFAYAGDGARVTDAPQGTGDPLGFAFIRVTRRSDGARHQIAGDGLVVNMDPAATSATVVGTLSDEMGSVSIYAALTATGSQTAENWQYAQVPSEPPGDPGDWYVESSTWLNRYGDGRGGFSSTLLGGSPDASTTGFIGRGLWIWTAA